MRELKYSIDNNGHGLIEMPCGTGKTITILSFLVAYKRKRPDIINKIGQGCKNDLGKWKFANITFYGEIFTTAH